MKILVAVKRAIDYNVKVRVKADGSACGLATCTSRYAAGERTTRPNRGTQ
jgi:electron transfer flavoprotein alpha/beta subunit